MALAHEPLSILIVDDDAANLRFLGELVGALGYAVATANSGAAALARLASGPRPDVVLIDVVMPDLDGVDTLLRYRAAGGDAPVVMCSARDEAEIVARAMRAGASDYVTKPFVADELREILERAADKTGKARALPAPKPSERHRLGDAPAMRAIDELIDRIADADVPVLITGESGVGKDVVAREIHARSGRARKVFIKINCAALPAELLESELFGHERGSFTGAQKQKPGQFELADGGTLFLDEIGEMPVAMQAKLLQALQDGEFYRVGGQRKIKVDTHVIVATNVDLARAMERGTFREDLYYRLNVVEVAIPPLRERREDIVGLLGHFLEKYGKRYGRPIAALPPEVMRRLCSYDYPGNIRELENLVRRLIVLGDPRYVLGELEPRAPTPPRLPTQAQPGTGTQTQTPPPTATAFMSLTVAFNPPRAPPGQIDDDYTIDLKDLGRRAANAAEREAIVLMLRHTGGHKRDAALRLGISYKAILYKIREFAIARPRNRRPAPPPPTVALAADGKA